MPKILFGLGSNLGDRQAILNNAVDRCRELFDVLAVSSWFTYPAVGGPGEQGDFLNGAILAETSLSPNDVHRALQSVEREAGRERKVRWSSRTLDCDLLLYDNEEVWTDDLKVPHPRMITRKFVLEPANDIACDMLHPTFGMTIGELFLHLQSAPPYFCVLSTDGNAALDLSRQIRDKTECLLLDQLTSFAGSSTEEALEWARQLVEDSRTSFQESTDSGCGCVSSTWVWEPWLTKLSADWSLANEALVASPILDPKLLIIVDRKDSGFGEVVGKRARELKVPTLFLSQDPQEALQDAVGAVLGMMM